MSRIDDRSSDVTDTTTARAGVQLWARGDVAGARQLLNQVSPSGDLSYFSLTIELPWHERDFDGVIAAWERPEIREIESLGGFFGYRELFLAQAYEHLGDHESAAELLQQGVGKFSDLDRDNLRSTVAFYLINLAELLVLQGEFERAVAIAEEAHGMTPIEADHITGVYIATSLSKVLARSGERDRALELLTKLIDRPAMVTRWELYLDPRWDFFRDDERFNDLIRPHNLEQ